MWNQNGLCGAIWTCLLLVQVGVMMGCDGGFSWDNYRRAVQSGRQQIQVVQELETLFPGEVQNFIGHHGGSIARPMTWNSEVLLYDRYVLTMQVKVRVNDEFSEITEVTDEPDFWIKEAVAIAQEPTGQWKKSVGRNWTFGLEEWNRVVAADGDFSAIDIALKKDQPVEHFQELHQKIRKRREPPS